MMAAIHDDLIRSTLSQVRYPGFSRDIVSFGLVKGIQTTGNDVAVTLQITTADAAIPQAIQTASEKALRALPGIGNVTVQMEVNTPAAQAVPGSAGPTAIQKQLMKAPAPVSSPAK